MAQNPLQATFRRVHGPSSVGAIPASEPLCPEVPAGTPPGA